MSGVIERRILANYRLDPEVTACLLPAPFRPQLVDGSAVGGICLIRLSRVRPSGMCDFIGIRSENAAHRFAVEWDDEADGSVRTGVFVPRRDTDSLLNHWAGGRFFPGLHHLARFTVEETERHVAVDLVSSDDVTRVSVSGQVAPALESRLFPSLAAASAFFEAGSLGYSATGTPGLYDGLELACAHWACEPLAVESVASSYFDDERRFPTGTSIFDHALLMRDIPHDWIGRESLRSGYA